MLGEMSLPHCPPFGSELCEDNVRVAQMTTALFQQVHRTAEWALAHAYSHREQSGGGEAWDLAKAFETLNALRVMLCATRFLTCAADAMGDLLLEVCSRFGACDAYLRDPSVFIQDVLSETMRTLQQSGGEGGGVAGLPAPFTMQSSFVPRGLCDAYGFPWLGRLDPPLRSLQLHHFGGIPFLGVDPFQILSALRDAGAATSKWVVNLGAGDGSCDRNKEDMANCLIAEGFGGVQVEAQPSLERALRKSLASRQDVVVLGRLAPNQALEMVRKERPAGLAGSPDLLKVDVDNGDCDFLEELLPLQPALIHVEVMLMTVPPPFVLRVRFNPAVQCTAADCEQPQSWRDNLRRRGCSLAAVEETLGSSYVLAGLVEPGHNVLFLRSDLGWAVPWLKVMSSWQLWRQQYFCHPLRTFAHGWEIWHGVRTDPARWADVSRPLCERAEEIGRYFKMAAYRENWSLRVLQQFIHECNYSVTHEPHQLSKSHSLKRFFLRSSGIDSCHSRARSRIDNAA